MATFEAVGDASLTLRQALTDALSGLTPAPTVEISDLVPAISTTPPRVTIFLYEVDEDASTRNRPATREIDSLGRPIVRRAPATLLLRYLITPWYDDAASAHTVLGRIVQAFHDEAIISGAALAPSLRVANEAIKLKLVPLTTEDKARVWHAINKPYRLSVVYEVRVIRIDSDDVRLSPPVTSMTVTPAVPDGVSP